MKRLCFTIRMSWYRRKEIGCIAQNKHHIKNILQLDPKKLKQLGINYIVLDFDGVLATYGQSSLDNCTRKWLKCLVNEYDEHNIFILSNKPTPRRVNYFAKHFPNIKFITNCLKKPYPDGLFKIQKKIFCKMHELALIDDRLLTGCLACILAGSFPLLVTNPRCNYLRYPLKESFFSLLRFIERLIFFRRLSIKL